MARIPIEMPKLGYDMETGVISSWVKQMGDLVARGDVIAEIGQLAPRPRRRRRHGLRPSQPSLSM